MFKYLLENKKVAYILLSIYWAILFIGTTLPGSQVPSLGMSDKSKHFGGYMVLTILLYITLLFQDKFKVLKHHSAVAAFSIIAVYGVLDELHQRLIPGRSCDINDWIADMIGVTIGLIILKLFLKKKLHPQAS